MNDTAETIPSETTDASGEDVSSRQEQKPSWLRAFWEEVKGLLLLLVAVLVFHSFIAKPFYIPSISMMPTLLVGDRLVVSKYPYGWSFVSPTIPSPSGIASWIGDEFAGRESDPDLSLSVMLPQSKGRVWGKMPQRGDIVIFTPEGISQDWIKRVIGLPGDSIALKDGQIILNGVPVKQETQPQLILPVDANNSCYEGDFPGALGMEPNGKMTCSLNIVRETLPNGVSYDTIDAKEIMHDNMNPVRIPAGYVFLMGDNRDNSSDSRFSRAEGGLGGPVAWERIGGRAEIITFSVDGSTGLNPATWFSSLRSGRAGTSLRPDRAEKGK